VSIKHKANNENFNSSEKDEQNVELDIYIVNLLRGMFWYIDSV